MRRWAGVVWCAAVVMGCGGNEAGPADVASETGGGDEAVAKFDALVDAWCPVMAAMWCEAAETCGCFAIPGFPEGGEACLGHADNGCRGELARFRPSVASGALVPAEAVPAGCEAAWAEALGACVRWDAAIRAATCALAAPVALRLPGDGEACADGLCAAGVRCNANGVCAAPVAGGSCAGAGDCVVGQFCVAGTCRDPDVADNGKACTGPPDCAGDTECYAAPRRICQMPVQDGACSDDRGCPADQFCDDRSCVPRPGFGAACGGGVACAADLACAFGGGPNDGTCQPLPNAGERCALGANGPFICAAGLACNFNVCGTPPEDGDACAVGDIRCADELGCHVVGGESICRPRGDAGSPCQLDDSCGEGLFCNFRTNRCTSTYAPGATCRDGNECGWDGACVPAGGTRFVCVVRPGEGQACFLDDSCEPGLVCKSPFETGTCAPAMCVVWQL